MEADRTPTERRKVMLDAATLDSASWGSGPITMILLHDGLGSIDQWRDLPADLAAATNATVIAYDRPGHGASTPIPSGAWPTDWMMEQAEALLELIDQLGVDAPVLVGHSDGGSIALLVAAMRPGAIGGVVALAAHSYVEPVCVDAIASMRARPDRIVAGLGRFHTDAAAVFEAWSAVWVSDDFRCWDIREQLGTIVAPTLIVQGTEDEYGTDAMATNTARAVGTGGCRCVLLPGVGHLLHHQAPAAIIELIAGHVASVSP